MLDVDQQPHEGEITGSLAGSAILGIAYSTTKKPCSRGVLMHGQAQGVMCSLSKLSEACKTLEISWPLCILMQRGAKIAPLPTPFLLRKNRGNHYAIKTILPLPIPLKTCLMSEPTETLSNS